MFSNDERSAASMGSQQLGQLNWFDLISQLSTQWTWYWCIHGKYRMLSPKRKKYLIRFCEIRTRVSTCKKTLIYWELNLGLFDTLLNISLWVSIDKNVCTRVNHHCINIKNKYSPTTKSFIQMSHSLKTFFDWKFSSV